MSALRVFAADPRQDRRKRARRIGHQAEAYESVTDGGGGLLQCTVDDCDRVFVSYQGHAKHWRAIHFGDGIEFYKAHPVGSEGKHNGSRADRVLVPAGTYCIVPPDQPIECFWCSAKPGHKFANHDSYRRHIQKGRHLHALGSVAPRNCERTLTCYDCLNMEGEKGVATTVNKHRKFSDVRALRRHVAENKHRYWLGKRPDLRDSLNY